MKGTRRQELAERLVFLHAILDFYVTTNHKVLYMTPEEVQAHIDDILDEINLTKQELTDEDGIDSTPDS